MECPVWLLILNASEFLDKAKNNPCAYDLPSLMPWLMNHEFQGFAAGAGKAFYLLNVVIINPLRRDNYEHV